MKITEEFIENVFGPQLDETTLLYLKEVNKKKKAAKSWIKGTKTFKDKIEKAKRAGMKDPEGFAAYMQHQVTGTWPSQD